jgi:spermidine synthase
MLPWEIVDRALAPDGTELVLARRGAEWVVRCGGRVLMSSRQHGSEDALATLALERLARRRSVLVGGLGLGFTLRAALDRLPVGARVVVAELTPALVAWNRGLLAKLAGRPLDDRRVRLEVGDVLARVAKSRDEFDAILLDVDNGPSSALVAGNASLYGDEGIAACHGALAPGGVLALWSAGPDERYRARLERHGFVAESRAVTARGEGSGGQHVVFLARKESAEAEEETTRNGKAARKGKTARKGKAPAPRRPR